MAHKLYNVGVKALITNSEGKILLLKAASRDLHGVYWDLPGGRIKDTQTAEEALRKEIEEEIGVTEVSGMALHSGCISNFEKHFDGLGIVGLVLMAYAVTIPDDAVIKLNDENTDCEWVERTELPERLKEKYPKEFTDGLLAR